MTLEVVPFSSASSEIDGLKIIHVKMVTDERGTVRELFRQSQHSQVLVNPNMAWKDTASLESMTDVLFQRRPKRALQNGAEIIQNC